MFTRQQALTFKLKKQIPSKAYPANTQQSYVFKPLNHARIKSGKVENIPAPLDKFSGDSVETNGDDNDAL